MTHVWTFVTGNAQKIEEFSQIAVNKIQFQAKNLELPELQGEPVEIAREKCKIAAGVVDGPVVVQDDSFGFNALGGLPGPFVKWFLKAIGPDGLVKMLEGFSDKTGYVNCIYAFSLGKDYEPEICQHITHGLIVSPRPGVEFGGESIFVPDDGNGKTYSEMRQEGTCKITYRLKALEKLILRLEQLGL